MIKKTLVIALALLALLLACSACAGIEPQSPEEKAYQFLSALLEDDTELQQAILDNVTVIGVGASAPSEEELAARQEQEAAFAELVESRFGGLASPELIANNAVDGQLTQWQTRLACTGAKAAINECSFTDKYSRMVFEGTVHCVNGEEETDLPLQGEVVFNEDGLIDSFHLSEDEFGFTGWLRAQDTISAAMQERIDVVVSQGEYSGIFTSYEQVIASDLQLKTEHGATGFEADDLGLFRDVNKDGIEELFVFFFVTEQETYPDDAYCDNVYCQAWTFDEGLVSCIFYDQLYQKVGGAKYGGAALVELEGRPYLCLWYQSSLSGDAEYIWYEEKYQLFDLAYLTQTDTYFSRYAKDNYASDENTLVLYQGSFDYVFLKNDDPIPEEEFFAVRQELRDSMEPLVGVYPQADGERRFAGQPLDELLGEMGDK